MTKEDHLSNERKEWLNPVEIVRRVEEVRLHMVDNVIGGAESREGHVRYYLCTSLT